MRRSVLESLRSGRWPVPLVAGLALAMAGEWAATIVVASLVPSWWWVAVLAARLAPHALSAPMGEGRGRPSPRRLALGAALSLLAVNLLVADRPFAIVGAALISAAFGVAHRTELSRALDPAADEPMPGRGAMPTGVVAAAGQAAGALVAGAGLLVTTPRVALLIPVALLAAAAVPAGGTGRPAAPPTRPAQGPATAAAGVAVTAASALAVVHGLLLAAFMAPGHGSRTASLVTAFALGAAAGGAIGYSNPRSAGRLLSSSAALGAGAVAVVAAAGGSVWSHPAVAVAGGALTAGVAAAVAVISFGGGTPSVSLETLPLRLSRGVLLGAVAGAVLVRGAPNRLVVSLGVAVAAATALRTRRARADLARAIEPTKAQIAARRRVLAGVEMLAKAPRSVLDRLAQGIEETRLEPGEAAIRQGRIPSYLYVVRSGTLAVRTTGETSGAAILVNTLRAGGCFGEVGLLEGMPSTATVRATTRCVLYRVRGADFLRAIEESPGLTDELMERVSGLLVTTHPSYRPAAGERAAVLGGRATPVIEEIVERVSKLSPQRQRDVLRLVTEAEAAPGARRARRRPRRD